MSTTILIVEADAAVAALIHRELLSQEDLLVIGVAASGHAALETISRLRPDLLLLASTLPDISGLQVLAALAGSESPPRTLLLAEDLEDETRALALRMGAAGYLRRSGSASQLTHAVRTVMQGDLWLSL